MNSIDDQVIAQVHNKVLEQFYAQLRRQVSERVEIQVFGLFRHSIWYQVWHEVYNQVESFGGEIDDE